MTPPPECHAAAPSGYYSEPFRPQYHFTPKKNWMNDPNGLVYYKGEYNLFYQYNPFGVKWGYMSWGHAVSPDLVHWKHLPLALPEANGVMCFSGSAVVDWHDTSGFGRKGRPPLVAIYTGMRVADGRQFQCLAFSNDKGLTWTKFSGNPVIDIGSRNFRDPKVQWYAPTKRWIMTVALSAEHKVRFYGSHDLKHWKLLSEFGPAGATSGPWECPDLFPLPDPAKPNKVKWVLTVNTGNGAPAGGNGLQYFIGNFDGIKFTEDGMVFPSSVTPVAKDGVCKFFGETHGANWRIANAAFGASPASPNILVADYVGPRIMDNYGLIGSDQSALISPKFTNDKTHLSFMIRDESHSGAPGMNLLLKTVAEGTAPGESYASLGWHTGNVRNYLGSSARLQNLDQYKKNGWNHVYMDQMVLGNGPAPTTDNDALWADYGPDFYAAVSWNDFPPSDGRRVWLGWMSNRKDRNYVPKTRWAGVMSVPRRLSLYRTTAGLRLRQEPVRELKELRTRHERFPGGDVSRANAWIERKHVAGDELELVLDFKPAEGGVEGVRVLKGPGEETVIGVDRAGGRVFVDGRRSGNVSYNPRFPRIFFAPLPQPTGDVKLHLFVDACSVEVFVDGGEQVFTVLVFPSEHSRRVELFGPKGDADISGLDVWTLKSIWK